MKAAYASVVRGIAPGHHRPVTIRRQRRQVSISLAIRSQTHRGSSWQRRHEPPAASRGPVPVEATAWAEPTAAGRRASARSMTAANARRRPSARWIRGASNTSEGAEAIAGEALERAIQPLPGIRPTTLRTLGAAPPAQARWSSRGTPSSSFPSRPRDGSRSPNRARSRGRTGWIAAEAAGTEGRPRTEGSGCDGLT